MSARSSETASNPAFGLAEETGLEPLAPAAPVQAKGPVRRSTDPDRVPAAGRAAALARRCDAGAAVDWCDECGARHAEGRCQGELLAREGERHGWRIAVRTPYGRRVHGVLIAPCGDVWRARILTYPRTLWAIPGGTRSMKFLGPDPATAEATAVDFVLDHCRDRGYAIVDEPTAGIETSSIDPECVEGSDMTSTRKPGRMTIRFGVERLTHAAETGDLSESGLFIATQERIDRGSALRLVLELAGSNVPLRGVVRWVRTRSGPGRPAGLGVHLIRPAMFYVQQVRKLP